MVGKIWEALWLGRSDFLILPFPSRPTSIQEGTADMAFTPYGEKFQKEQSPSLPPVRVRATISYPITRSCVLGP